jgi:hypothetical protein
MHRFRRGLLATAITAALAIALSGLAYRIRSDTVTSAGAGCPRWSTGGGTGPVCPR